MSAIPPELVKQARPTEDLRQALFESQVPGAHFAGFPLRSPTKTRVPSDPIFTVKPVGDELEELLSSVVAAASGEWKTLCLIVGEAGMPFAFARRVKWTQTSGSTISWESRAGYHEVEKTELLNHHLGALTRTSDFVLPGIALVAAPWAKRDWLKSCNNLPITQKNIIRRFSVWPSLLERYHKLALKGLLPQQHFTPHQRDLKRRVRERLEQILSSSVPVYRPGGSERVFWFRPMTLEEIGILVTKLHGEWRLAVLILFYLFISVGELCRLTWEQFDLRSGTVDLQGRKKTFVHPTLLRVLRRWPGTRTGKVCSFHSDTRTISAAISKFRDAGVGDPSVRLTSVRRTSLKMLAQFGVNVHERGNVLLAGGYGGKMPTQEAKEMLLRKGLKRFPDVLAHAARKKSAKAHDKAAVEESKFVKPKALTNH